MRNLDHTEPGQSDNGFLGDRISATEAEIVAAIALLPETAVDFAFFAANNDLVYYLTASNLSYQESRWILDQIFFAVQTSDYGYRIHGKDADIIWQYVILPSHDQIEKYKAVYEKSFHAQGRTFNQPGGVELTSEQQLEIQSQELNLVWPLIKTLFHPGRVKKDGEKVERIFRAVIQNEQYEIDTNLLRTLRMALKRYQKYFTETEANGFEFTQFEKSIVNLVTKLYNYFS